MKEEYKEFLTNKKSTRQNKGFVPDFELNPHLKDFQKYVALWALKKGKSAVFAGTGLGKTIMQLSWADAVCKHTGGNSLVLAPLAVADQVIDDEAPKFGFEVGGFNDGKNITITNYEKIHKLDLAKYNSIVLDESSILKNFDGKTRDTIIGSFKNYEYKLAATATPSPNDFMELGNHAEFLDVCSYHEMLATYFMHDGGETQKWRLKGHARDDFWAWVNSWAVMFENPSEIGFDGSEYILPDLNQETIVTEAGDRKTDGRLFAFQASELKERIQERRDSVNERCEKCAELAHSISDRPIVIWCNLLTRSPNTWHH